ncbi:hypothetical protein EV138_5595 [Kribbella voronezhensis]|uniref:Uncharacterized protein n=1 Tax=Kribbella voronezhensis TaxID=2512212 RepID=A0A4R7SWW6_9ACTN|nr:hypothetical protein [Kribbella voronezhensis]TDU83136.1 hypothetical protein EV138_5595 [Kribbella voronezhensis]
MDIGEFATDVRRRVQEARQALLVAESESDFYAVDVRTGELNSLLRMAAENDVTIEPAPADRQSTKG